MMRYLVILFASAVSHAVVAQTYYQDGVPVTADGITFNVKLGNSVWVLSNAENTRTKVVMWQYKDGREIESKEEFDRVQFELYSANTVAKVLKDTFSFTEMTALKGLKTSPMNIYYVFGPDGSVLEVSFIMDMIPELLSIPPERFAQLEKNLKKYVKAWLNVYAQQMQFVGAGQMIGFKYIDEQAAAAENPPIDRPIDPRIPGDRDDPIIDDQVYIRR